MFTLVCEWETEDMTHTEFHGAYDSLEDAKLMAGVGNGDWNIEDPEDFEFNQKEKTPVAGMSTDKLFTDDGNEVRLEGHRFLIWEYR